MSTADVVPAQAPLIAVSMREAFVQDVLQRSCIAARTLREHFLWERQSYSLPRAPPDPYLGPEKPSEGWSSGGPTLAPPWGAAVVAWVPLAAAGSFLGVCSSISAAPKPV